MSFNLVDLTTRLQLLGQKYADLTNTFCNNLKWGKQCAKAEWKELILLSVYIELLEKYDLDSDNNCITEDQLDTLFDVVSKLIKVTFKPASFSYTTPPESSQFDDSFDGSFF